MSDESKPLPSLPFKMAASDRYYVRFQKYHAHRYTDEKLNNGNGGF